MRLGRGGGGGLLKGLLRRGVGDEGRSGRCGAMSAVDVVEPLHVLSLSPIFSPTLSRLDSLRTSRLTSRCASRSRSRSICVICVIWFVDIKNFASLPISALSSLPHLVELLLARASLPAPKPSPPSKAPPPIVAPSRPRLPPAPLAGAAGAPSEYLRLPMENFRRPPPVPEADGSRAADLSPVAPDALPDFLNQPLEPEA